MVEVQNVIAYMALGTLLGCSGCPDGPRRQFGEAFGVLAEPWGHFSGGVFDRKVMFCNIESKKYVKGECHVHKYMKHIVSSQISENV